MRLTGTIVGDPEAFSLVMAAPFVDLPVELDSVHDDGRFVARVPLRVSMWGGAPSPPMRGPYDLEGRLGNERFSTFVSQELIDRVPIIESRPDMRLRLELGQRDGLRARITRPRSELEYGSYRQAILADKFAHGGTSAIDAVYFESFSDGTPPATRARSTGRSRAACPTCRGTGAVEDCSVEVPEGATPLVTGTQDWWRVRESARVGRHERVAPPGFVKRGFQTVLQTWHGSMYKKIGLDRSQKGRTQPASVPGSSAATGTCSSPRTPTRPRSSGAPTSFPEASSSRRLSPQRRAARPRPGADRPTSARGSGSRKATPPSCMRPHGGRKLRMVGAAGPGSSCRSGCGPTFTFLQRGHVRTLELGAEGPARQRHRCEHVPADQRPLPRRPTCSSPTTPR